MILVGKLCQINCWKKYIAVDTPKAHPEDGSRNPEGGTSQGPGGETPGTAQGGGRSAALKVVVGGGDAEIHIF